MATATLSVSVPMTERTQAQTGLFTRLLKMVMEARMRQAMAEMRRYDHLIPHDEAADFKVGLSSGAQLPFSR